MDEYINGIELGQKRWVNEQPNGGMLARVNEIKKMSKWKKFGWTEE